MKTKNTNQISGLNRSEQLGEGKAGNSKEETPRVNLEKRAANREMPCEEVLEKLQETMPAVYRLAEVVGKWVWVAFEEQPPADIRAQLSELGFSWNRKRECWQHPGGEETFSRKPSDPREKYRSYFRRMQRRPERRNAREHYAMFAGDGKACEAFPLPGFTLRIQGRPASRMSDAGELATL